MDNQTNTLPLRQRAHEEIGAHVVSTRLALYNRGLPCGPKAILERMREECPVAAFPSARTIARLLTRNGLTHNRTGLYEEDIMP